MRTRVRIRNKKFRNSDFSHLINIPCYVFTVMANTRRNTGEKIFM